MRPTARDYALSAKLQAMMVDNMTDYKAAWKEPLRSHVVNRKVPSKDGECGEYGGCNDFKLAAEVLQLPILVVTDKLLECSDVPPFERGIGKQLSTTMSTGHLEWFACTRGKSYSISLSDAIRRLRLSREVASPPIVVAFNGADGKYQ